MSVDPHQFKVFEFAGDGQAHTLTTELGLGELGNLTSATLLDASAGVELAVRRLDIVPIELEIDGPVATDGASGCTNAFIALVPFPTLAGAVVPAGPGVVWKHVSFG